jgi:N-acetylglucosaminyldiphosphoundecaprenol N-acetyl-beta-D-mannosaminyltransferase
MTVLKDSSSSATQEGGERGSREQRQGGRGSLGNATNASTLMSRNRTNILGVAVSAINMDDAIERIDRWIEQRTPNYICITGAHGIMESRKDFRLRDIHNQAGLVTPDGMPLVWMSRWLGAKRVERVYGPDLMRAISARSPGRNYRHFYFGGAPGVADRLATALVAANPRLKVVGTLCPPFRPLTPEEDAEMVARINVAGPDIVWVGLSTPKQEYWMASHIGRINAPVLIGVGAAFDFLAGTKRQAPTWMQHNGLEWLFRLCVEPRRLWRRYAYIVPGFLMLAVGELIRSALGSSEAATSK